MARATHLLAFFHLPQAHGSTQALPALDDALFQCLRQVNLAQIVASDPAAAAAAFNLHVTLFLRVLLGADCSVTRSAFTTACPFTTEGLLGDVLAFYGVTAFACAFGRLFEPPSFNRSLQPTLARVACCFACLGGVYPTYFTGSRACHSAIPGCCHASTTIPAPAFHAVSSLRLGPIVCFFFDARRNALVFGRSYPHGRCRSALGRRLVRSFG